MTIPAEQFIRDFTKELRSNNAAIFAGAGLSIPAGFVDWKGSSKTALSFISQPPVSHHLLQWCLFSAAAPSSVSALI